MKSLYHIDGIMVVTDDQIAIQMAKIVGVFDIMIQKKENSSLTNGSVQSRVIHYPMVTDFNLFFGKTFNLKSLYF